jgi:hypothetical protein
LRNNKNCQSVYIVGANENFNGMLLSFLDENPVGKLIDRISVIISKNFKLSVSSFASLLFYRSELNSFEI